MIDVGTWDLTIPEGTPAKTISTSQLKKGYQSKYFRKDGVQIEFWSPVTGTSTQGSTYPRSELRETYSFGFKRNWKYTAAHNQMRAKLSVDQVPSSGKIIIGQIHALNHPYPYLKVVYSQIRGVGYVTVEIRAKPTDSKSPTVMTYPSMPLGHEFTYDINLSKSGLLTTKINGLTHQEQIDPAWGKLYMYFKAGAYVIDNEGPVTEGGRVTFQELKARHY
jgi:hypothetical protein